MDRPYVLTGLVVIALSLGLLAYLLEFSSVELWTGILVASVLVVVSVPMIRRLARTEGDPWLVRTLIWGLVATLLFSVFRYLFIFALNDGSADAGLYDAAGRTFVERLRAGEPIHPIPVMRGFPVESQRLGDVTGAVYALTSPSIHAGFFVFAYVCFWGKVLMIRGFRAAVPEGDHRRFALLVLFLPSLLFWPSSIGKEALMFGCLGIIMYGGALLLAPRPRFAGAIYFAVGALLVLMVRPHIALMSILGFGLAMVVGVLGGSGGGAAGAIRGRTPRLVALGVVAVLAVYGITRLGQQFEEFGEEGAQAVLEGALEQSSIGGSEFAPVAVTGPREAPAAVVSVLFRPFPWEASSASSLLTAAESLLLLGLVAVSWRRLMSLPRLMLRRPFLVSCLAYVLLFSIAFSYIGNFGILARKRVLVFPVVLVLLALP